MTYKKHLRGIYQYKEGTSREVDMLNANPHRVIQIMMETCITYLTVAKGAIERDDQLAKTQAVQKAQGLITALRLALDYDKGQDVAITLNNLYDYLGRRLAQASVAGSLEMLDEVKNLMQTIKDGWDGIQEEAEAMFAEQEGV